MTFPLWHVSAVLQMKIHRDFPPPLSFKSAGIFSKKKERKSLEIQQDVLSQLIIQNISTRRASLGQWPRKLIPIYAIIFTPAIKKNTCSALRRSNIVRH